MSDAGGKTLYLDCFLNPNLDCFLNPIQGVVAVGPNGAVKFEVRRVHHDGRTGGTSASSFLSTTAESLLQNPLLESDFRRLNLR